jgi:hypothetical protein
MDIFYTAKCRYGRVTYNNASMGYRVLCGKHYHGINPFSSVFP